MSRTWLCYAHELCDIYSGLLRREQCWHLAKFPPPFWDAWVCVLTFQTERGCPQAQTFAEDNKTARIIGWIYVCRFCWKPRACDEKKQDRIFVMPITLPPICSWNNSICKQLKQVFCTRPFQELALVGHFKKKNCTSNLPELCDSKNYFMPVFFGSYCANIQILLCCNALAYFFHYSIPDRITCTNASAHLKILRCAIKSAYRASACFLFSPIY